MEEKKGSKKKKGTGKKIVVGFLGVGLIVGLTIAGTLAFLNATSETKTNTFTASDDIVLGLDEPKYNVTTDQAGNEVVANASKPNPLDYQPETTYDKDPTLYNLTGTNYTSPEWVAIRVDYGMEWNGSVSAVTYEQLKHTCTETSCGLGTQSYNCTSGLDKGGVINEISFNEEILDNNGDVTQSGNWIRIPVDQIKALDTTVASKVIKYDIFVYKYKLYDKSGITTLAAAQADGTGLTESNGTVTQNSGVITAAGGKTTSLFDSITVQTKQQLINNGHHNANGLLDAPRFKIIVKGGAAKDDDTIESDIEEINRSEMYTSGKDSYEIVSDLVKLLNKQDPTWCQTAHYGRCEPHFDFGRSTSPIVPHRYLTQIISGITADCRSLV